MIELLTSLWFMAQQPVFKEYPVAHVEAQEEALELDLYNYSIPWLDGLKISLDDFELICKTVYCEAGLEPQECQVLVARTILFRLASDKFPNTVHDVIYAKNAYTVTNRADFETVKYTDEVECSVFLAIAQYPDEPFDMFYFRNAHYHAFGIPYRNIGYTYFSTEE